MNQEYYILTGTRTERRKMPELPEVETIKRSLEKHLINKEIENINIFYRRIIKNSISQFKKACLKVKIQALERHGKYLFFSLAGGKSIVCHLRMTGQLLLKKKEEKPDKHTHLEFYFKGARNKLMYRDVRKFGTWEILLGSKEEYIIKKKLGPDGLVLKFPGFLEKIRKYNKCIKAVLLDQQFIAGIGNIYADEILFRAGIRPDRETNRINEKEIQALFKTIKPALLSAIQKKGTSISDYINGQGKKGKFQLELKVYQRGGESCCECNSRIKKIRTAGRGTHFCPHCQH